MAESSGDIQVSGFIEKQAMFERLLTSEPRFDLNVRSVIRKVLQEARKNLSRDAASYIENDPRKAARAVKHTVYKQLFGGNVSILNKRRAGNPSSSYRPERKLQPGQVGGNRRPRSQRTNQVDGYMGSDRGFILRFINEGTANRQTRYGSRGALRSTNWFGHTAPWHMETAAEELAAAINEYVKQQANG